MIQRGAAYSETNCYLPLTAATVSWLAQLAVQLVVRTGSSESRCVLLFTTLNTGALDQNKMWLTG